jgi:hypothetical protein
VGSICELSKAWLSFESLVLFIAVTDADLSLQRQVDFRNTDFLKRDRLHSSYTAIFISRIFLLDNPVLDTKNGLCDWRRALSLAIKRHTWSNFCLILIDLYCRKLIHVVCVVLPFALLHFY